MLIYIYPEIHGLHIHLFAILFQYMKKMCSKSTHAILQYILSELKTYKWRLSSFESLYALICVRV